MPNFTPNLNLIKPLGDENFSVSHANSNADKIDAAFGDVDVQFEQMKKVQMLATDLGLVDNDPSKATENYNLINSFINDDSGRVLFLNGGKFWISQKLIMTKPNTAIIGNNRGKNPDLSCLIGSFQDSLIEISIPSGMKGSFLQNISLDGNNVCTIGLNIVGNNFHNNDFDTILIKSINGIGLKIGQNNYTSKYESIATSNCLVGLTIESNGNQQSNFLDCQFIGSQYGAVIGSENNSQSGLRCINFDNCDFTSPGTPLKINKTIYAIKFNRCWIEKASSGVLSDYLVELGTENVTAMGITFDTSFLQSNAKTNYIFKWNNASDIAIIGGTKTLSFVVGYIDATNAINTSRDSVFLCLDRINTTNAVSGKKINELFKLWVGDSSPSEAQFKTNLVVDPDMQTASAGNGLLIGSKRRSEGYNRVTLSEVGLLLGSGVTAPDTMFRRIDANVGGMSVGDSFRVDGSWNGGRLLLGNYNFWVDVNGNLRIKNGVPTNDLDGSIVGTQS